MGEEAAGQSTGGNPEGGSPQGSTGEGDSGSQDLQSQLAATEERRRKLQGEADRLKSEKQALEGKLASFEEVEARLAGLEGKLDSFKVPSVDEFAAAMQAHQQVNDYRASLATQYPGLDLSKVTGRTPEEISANAKAAFDEKQALVTAARAEAEAAVRAEYAKKYGESEGNADPADQGDGGSPQGGTLTLDQFVKMDPKQAANLPDDVFNRMMGEAAAKGLM